MRNSKRLNNIARRLAARSGTNERAAEIQHHLDEDIAQGRNASVADIVSLVLLRLRSNKAATVMSVMGLSFVAVGLFIALAPFISVSRLSGESLDLLPRVAAAEVRDDARGGIAMFDSDEFLLATRTYEATAIEDVETALRESGFRNTRGHPTTSKRGFGITCCGDYDQLIVFLETVGDDTVATTTARDTDITVAWFIFTFLGGASIFVGLLLLAAARQQGPRGPQPGLLQSP